MSKTGRPARHPGLCPRCGLDKRAKDDGWCRKCRSEASRARKPWLAQRVRLNALITAWRQQPCTDCGLVAPDIMEADHTRDKKANVGRISGLARLIEELAKCEPVCPNCHRRRTNARRGA